MFTKRIIPCLDVNQGRVVKGINFVDLRDAETRLKSVRRMADAALTNWFFLI